MQAASLIVEVGVEVWDIYLRIGTDDCATGVCSQGRKETYDGYASHTPKNNESASRLYKVCGMAVPSEPQITAIPIQLLISMESNRANCSLKR